MFGFSFSHPRILRGEKVVQRTYQLAGSNWWIFVTSFCFQHTTNERFAVWSIESDMFKRSVTATKKFRGGAQQDSHEFLEAFLDGLHDELNLHSGKKFKELEIKDSDSDAQKFDKTWKNWSATNYSIISEIFYGQLQNKVTCAKCEKESTVFDAPSILCSLALPPKMFGTISLSQCLDEYTRKETLSGSNLYKCPRCKVKREAYKQLSISRFPPVMIIQLKRFTPDGRKIFTPVEFPPTLDLHSHFAGEKINTQYRRGQSRYGLVGVIRHIQSGSFRHYTSFVRLPSQSSQDNWVEFDDRSYKNVSKSDVFRTSSDPYILFYQQQG